MNLNGIGVLDDFLQLGGTSILAARVAFLLQEESGKSDHATPLAMIASMLALCD